MPVVAVLAPVRLAMRAVDAPDAVATPVGSIVVEALIVGAVVVLELLGLLGGQRQVNPGRRHAVDAVGEALRHLAAERRCIMAVVVRARLGVGMDGDGGEHERAESLRGRSSAIRTSSQSRSVSEDSRSS